MKTREEILKMKPFQRISYFSIQRNSLLKKYYAALDSEKHAKIYSAVFAIGGLVGFINPNYVIANIFILLGAGAMYLVSRSYKEKALEIKKEIEFINNYETTIKIEEESQKEKERINKEELQKEKTKQEEKEIEKEIVEINKKIELLELYKSNYESFSAMYENGTLEDYLKSINYTIDEATYLLNSISEFKKQSTMKLTMNNK